MRFSDRVGATTPATSLLVESVTDELRHGLWNVVQRVLLDDDRHITGLQRAFEMIWERFFKRRLIDLDAGNRYRATRQIAEVYYEPANPWWWTLNFVDWCHENQFDLNPSIQGHAPSLTDEFNEVFQREHCGYRFVSGVLSPITSPIEVEALANGIAATEAGGLGGAATHLRQALQLFSQRPTPDFRNSIKESISALESIAKTIGGSSGSGIDGPLKVLAAKVSLHGALRSGISSMYGYTSDESGIRHALLDQAEVFEEDAHFMLVSCSALAHFLTRKAERAGLLR
jgi:hypothetical protein